jgi:antitoxin HigA-1
MNIRKPIHPGDVLLQDVIEPLGISITEAAKRLGVSQDTLAALLNTNSSVTPEMAVRIGKATRTTPESWLQMQVKYDLWIVNQKTFEVKEWTASSEAR